MNKPKYDEQRQVDSWICCWCGEDNNHEGDILDFDLHTGDDVGTCRKCGKQNRVMFSIEYLSQPIEEED